ncbi:hypothetical protein EI94DRAFT_1742653 [Lactarius quietus]|nr:hypothetical protein EI94DRAFT_1742653 [Lactarius quietus]
MRTCLARHCGFATSFTTWNPKIRGRRCRSAYSATAAVLITSPKASGPPTSSSRARSRRCRARGRAQLRARRRSVRSWAGRRMGRWGRRDAAMTCRSMRRRSSDGARNWGSRCPRSARSIAWRTFRTARPSVQLEIVAGLGIALIGSVRNRPSCICLTSLLAHAPVIIQ